MNFQLDSPLGAALWAVAVAVPVGIVLLYFLKLRRRPVEVPSTYLWLRTVEDLHVNSLWQRLRRNLLLFLQLLAAGLVLLALLGISWRGTRLVGERFVLLVDTSASMSAREDGQTRLERARQEALAAIEQMDPDAVAMIVAFSDQAQVLQSFTDSRPALRAALQRLRPTARRTRLREALLVASGLANPGRMASDPTDVPVPDPLPATLVLLSDGRFPVPDVPLGNLKPRFLPIGNPQTQNLAITAFQVDRPLGQTGSWQAFAQVDNFGSQARRVLVELRRGDVLLDAQEVEVPAEGGTSVVFELGQMEPGPLELRLKIDDALALDNTAWAVINPPQRADVLLVTPGNEPLELALQTSLAGELCNLMVQKPEYLQTKEYRHAALAGTFDLVIFDRCQVPLDAETKRPLLPLANTWHLGSLPPLPAWSGEGGPPKLRQQPQVIDLASEHPLMQLVDFSGVDIVEGFSVPVPSGGHVLLEADTGPLLVVAPREGFLDLVQGFTLIDTDPEGQTTVTTNWPIRTSFPVFILNVLQVLGQAEQMSRAMNLLPGEPALLRINTTAKELAVVAPDGKRFPLRRRSGNLFSFLQTDTPGVYRVVAGEQVVRWFTVNLFDRDESDVRARHEVQIRHQQVAGSAVRQPIRRPLWRWALLVALGVLLVEWAVFARRVSL